MNSVSSAVQLKLQSQSQSQSQLLQSCRRFIQHLTHPQKFTRLLKLTDGSSIHVTTLSPPPVGPNGPAQLSVSRLNLDSANHPSWNPALRDRLMLNEQGQVAKFRAKFSNSNSNTNNTNNTTSGNQEDNDTSDFSSFAEMDPELGSIQVAAPKKKIIPQKSGQNKNKKKK